MKRKKTGRSPQTRRNTAKPPDEQFVHVRDWWRFQHYHSRTQPPWIRVYALVLEDPTFATLPDVEKAHLVGVWLLASRLKNRIPYDDRFVANRINATEPVDLKALIDTGLLVPCKRTASNTLASCEQCASPEERRVEESREEESREEGEDRREEGEERREEGGRRTWNGRGRDSGHPGDRRSADATRLATAAPSPARSLKNTKTTRATRAPNETSAEWTERRRREQKARLAGVDDPEDSIPLVTLVRNEEGKYDEVLTCPKHVGPPDTSCSHPDCKAGQPREESRPA